MVFFFLIFLIVIAVKNHFNFQGLVGYAVCLSNTWGLFLAILLLGYGLVEIPRKLWQEGNRQFILRSWEWKTAVVYDNSKEIIKDILQTRELMKKMGKKIDESSVNRQYFERIRSEFPNIHIHSYIDVNIKDFKRMKSEDPKSVIGALKKKFQRSQEYDYNDLIKLRVHIRRLSRKQWLAQSQWKFAVKKSFELQNLIDLQDSGTLKGVARIKVLWYPILMRTLSIICAILSIIIVWCEVTIVVSVNLSPISVILEALKDGNGGLRKNVIQLAPVFILLTYFCVCAFYGLFRLRLASYYHMETRGCTEENSMLFNGAYLMRLVFPLGYNFLGICKTRDAAFHEIIAKMEVIPFFGTSFNHDIPILIAILCIINLFRGYGKFLRCFSQFRGVDSVVPTPDNFENDTVDKGRMLLRREKRKRAKENDDSSKSIVERHKLRVEDQKFNFIEDPSQQDWEDGNNFRECADDTSGSLNKETKNNQSRSWSKYFKGQGKKGERAPLKTWST